MDIILIKKSDELVKLSKELGFPQAYFLEDIEHISGNNKKEILAKSKNAKKQGKFIIYQAFSEETLRFVLEKTEVNLVYGMENINESDSLHYPRGGLDQILCKIAVERDKIIAFSFNEILNSTKRSKLLNRIIFNLKLCGKYKVKTGLFNFAKQKEELRSKKDLEAFFRILNSDRKI